MDVLILAGLILLNGVFAMSEIALVTARKSRLQKLADNGDKGATSAIKLGEEPTRFLSTVQIGITAIGILNGVFGEAALAAPLADNLQQLGLAAKTSSIAATTIVVVGITYLSIVIGELVPKRLAQLSPENIARLMARPLTVLASLSRPFVFLLATSTELTLRLLGKHGTDNQGDVLTEEDIKAVLAEGSQTGVIEKQEHAMVKNVFHFDDRKVTSLMTPRNEIVALDLDKPSESNLNYLVASCHQHFPVIKGNMDNPKGIITTKQLLQYHIARPRSPIEHYLLPPVFIPENWTGIQLLEHFRHSGDVMAFVVDEYGDIQGIVTPKDILEALAGEFKTRAPEDIWSVENEDGSWSMDGLIPILVLKDLLELETLPDEDKNGYHTLSGMLMWSLSGLPSVGDSIEWEGWQFEVTQVDGNRADKVSVTRKAPVEIEAADDTPIDEEDQTNRQA
ncbi:membrane protein [Photobacterium gaetbulicola]|uniref:Membrane protein n=1 Tax=Photobacterium gaetbulicola TaxID=1295392 RepID=A0A0B9G069_9GAMM|nr:hemolysin family protein [Photobacterium gaetbulicola]KHT61999.1 membrane protein [Photobacterium gaetbulicola]